MIACDGLNQQSERLTTIVVGVNLTLPLDEGNPLGRMTRLDVAIADFTMISESVPRHDAGSAERCGSG